MDHAAALRHAAQVTGHAAQRKFHSDLLGEGICCHNCHSRLVRTLCAGFQISAQRRQGVLNRLNGQDLPDNTGRHDQNFFRLDAQFFGSQSAHSLRLFLAVCVAGVGVLGVCHHCHGLAAGGFQMLFHHQHRRTLHLVLGVDRSRIAHGICRNHHQVIFLVRVVLDAAVYAAGTESLCGTNAAFDNLHNCFLLLKSEV